MTEITSFASIPAIMAICFFIAEAYKWFITDKDGEIHDAKASAFIPVLCGAVGLILGVSTYYSNPNVIHSDNVLAAAATGITSGLASVGVRQHISKNKKTD